MKPTQHLILATYLMDKVAQITESHPSSESMLKGQSTTPPHKVVDETQPVDSYLKSAASVQQLLRDADPNHALSVASGDSVAIPKPALVAAGGTGLGALAGDAFANAATSDDEHRRRNTHIGAGVGGILGYLISSNPSVAKHVIQNWSRKSAAQQKFVRRRRLLATLIPALVAGGYGAALGASAPVGGGPGMFDQPHPAGASGALLGGAMGALAGGGIGYGAARLKEWAGMDPYARTVAMAKTAYVKDPQDMSGQVGNLNELRKLVGMVDANPSKLPPAEDVLQNNSITVPKGVLRGGAGAAGGALAGGALASLFSGPIDPAGTEEEAAGKRRTRHVGAGIGGALGLWLASRKDIANSGAVNSLRQKFAV